MVNALSAFSMCKFKCVVSQRWRSVVASVKPVGNDWEHAVNTQTVYITTILYITVGNQHFRGSTYWGWESHRHYFNLTRNGMNLVYVS